jgi:hypothetical protein
MPLPQQLRVRRQCACLVPRPRPRHCRHRCRMLVVFSLLRRATQMRTRRLANEGFSAVVWGARNFCEYSATTAVGFRVWFKVVLTQLGFRSWKQRLTLPLPGMPHPAAIQVSWLPAGCLYNCMVYSSNSNRELLILAVNLTLAPLYSSIVLQC